MEIRRVFDELAATYDRERQKLIPCFDDFYGTIAELAGSAGPCARVLDLGAGTGLLSHLLWSRLPGAEWTLLDFSEEMLRVAKNRFAKASSIRFVVADYSSSPLNDRNDRFTVVVSSLSIHHLDDAAKKALYARIYESLDPGGVFVMGDLFLAPDAENEALCQAHWKRSIEATDLSREKIEAAYGRMTLDRPATVAQSLDWLGQAGFRRSHVFYQYYNFGVLAGWKER